MATKKKTAAKKTPTPPTKKTKVPPRQVWIVIRDDEPGRTVIPASATTRTEALRLVDEDGERVVGPYVLAERKRER